MNMPRRGIIGKIGVFTPVNLFLEVGHKGRAHRGKRRVIHYDPLMPPLPNTSYYERKQGNGEDDRNGRWKGSQTPQETKPLLNYQI